MKQPKTFRLSPELAGRLRGRAELEGVSMSAVVERALSAYFQTAGGSSRADLPRGDRVSPPAGTGGPPAEIDLANWLQGRTGLPRAICARHIAAGRVTVAGERCDRQRIPLTDVESVLLDGAAP